MNEICVYCEDDATDALIPKGKQSSRPESYSCFYTRTTGIWQTVWLEFLPEEYIDSAKYYADINEPAVTVCAELRGKADFSAEVFYEGELMGSYKACNVSGTLNFTIRLAKKYLWEVGNGRLYDIKFKFGNDEVQSYFGLRQVRIDG